MKIRHNLSIAVVLFVGLLTGAMQAPAGVIGELGILDGTANGGINPATGAAWEPGDTYRLFFISRDALRSLTASDISVYHAVVQGAADAAGLGETTLGDPVSWYCVGQSKYSGSYDVQANAYDHGSTDVGVFRIDGVLLANSTAGMAFKQLGDPALSDPLLLATPNITEYGEEWAGTYVSTGGYEPNYFGDWSSGHCGLPTRTDYGWYHSAGGLQSNLTLRHFYAISVDLTMQYVPPAGTVFILE